MMIYRCLLVLILFSGCSEDKSPDATLTWKSLTQEHNLGKLVNFDYDKNENVYVLGYYDDTYTGRYEVRDANFNIVKSRNLGFIPYSILYTPDSLYASEDLKLFQARNGTIVYTMNGGRISTFDPSTNEHKVLFNDPTAPSYIQYNDFAESDEFYFLSIYSSAVCVRIDKTSFAVTTFPDVFEQFKAKAGYSLVTTNEGDIILSMMPQGLIVSGYLIYKDGTWKPFHSETLPKFGPMNLIDSRDFAWINSANNSDFKIYNSKSKEILKTNPPLLSGNFYGFGPKEDLNGNILYLTGPDNQQNQLMQLIIK